MSITHRLWIIIWFECIVRINHKFIKIFFRVKHLLRKDFTEKCHCHHMSCEM